ncbi:MAG TPA: BACON domain-containing carbohydrate-binding protein, partial [Verrucomicrobiae bacterium]|nr:BACON domain-containing carbohydrate-binding protein [Verrucomicrobiae bacterium]
MRVTPSGANVVVSWQGGSSPYQLLSRTNLNGEWRKVGSPTSGYQVTNPAMPSPMCFYRVTTDLTAPLIPGGLVVSTNTDETQLVLRWNAVTDNTGGAGVKGYNIYRNNLFVKRVLPTATTTIDTGLTPDTAYSYTVSAEDFVANESARSTTVSGRTPRRGDNTAPTIPSGLTATAANCNLINLSWVASTDTGGSGLKGYNVYRGGAFIALVLVPATTYTDSGRTASTTYSYTVSALDNANNQSAQSASWSATTPACPDLATPSIPAALTATAASCNQINLSWSASTDTGGSGLRGYNVYRGGTYVTQVLAPSTYYYDTGRAASTSYGYTVQAVDNANNFSVQSIARTATTPACPCSYSIAPTTVSVDVLGTLGTVNVNAGAGCAWIATSGAAWITITSGLSGSGNGAVGYSVTANTSTSPRNGTLTIAGQSFSVTQAG